MPPASKGGAPSSRGSVGVMSYSADGPQRISWNRLTEGKVPGVIVGLKDQGHGPSAGPVRPISSIDHIQGPSADRSRHQGVGHMTSLFKQGWRRRARARLQKGRLDECRAMACFHQPRPLITSSRRSARGLPPERYIIHHIISIKANKAKSPKAQGRDLSIAARPPAIGTALPLALG